MDSVTELRVDGLARPRAGIFQLSTLVLLALFAWQGWMTLTLFGSDPWSRLRDDEPIVSGHHPLHFYHGLLGAQSLRERGTSCCYDPAFQAGYPKTSVFDSGSRPAELFLTLAQGDHRPAAYKIGLAVCCLAVPLLLWIAARGVGLSPATACLAIAGGLLVFWGTPGRRMLQDGDLDQLLAGLAALAQVGLLVQFHHRPGLLCWMGLVITGCLGCFAQPVLFGTLLPLLLVYYFCVGTRHSISWHVALLGSLAGGIALNSFWLVDWFAYWWIRSPLQPQIPVLTHRTFHTLWAAPLWGDGTDRIVAGILIATAALGVVLFNEMRQRTAARLLGLGAGGFLVLAVTGITWEPLGRLGTAQLLVPGLWFAALPAAYAVMQSWLFACRLLGAHWKAALLLWGCASTLGYFAQHSVREFLERCSATAPLQIGLPSEAQELIEIITAHTTSEARILVEDQTGAEGTPHWTALLPLFTERVFLGGLDTDASIDHAYASLLDQNLAGRPIASITDSELHDFCRRYNVGWVVCRSPAVSARFKSWAEAERVAEVAGPVSYCLYQLPFRSFTLKGQARLLSADWRHIALADVVPEDGEVVLSLHYQEGLRASPSRVQIQKDPDARDPIPLIRLKVPSPVAHLTLSWQPR
jgi:hypothetical protein